MSDIIEIAKNVFSSSTFWILMLAGTMLAWGTMKKIVGKLPVVNNRKTMMLFSAVMLVWALGLFGTLGFGSLAASSSVAITDLQVTTSFATGAGGSIAEDTLVPDTVNVRMTDAQLNETTGVLEVSTGVITVTRSGDLTPASVPVTVSYSLYNSEKTPSDGVNYAIVDRTAANEPKVYLKDGGAAATTDSKGQTQLAFGDGVAIKTLGVVIEGSEAGHDALNQYSSRPVYVTVGEGAGAKTFTFNLIRMD